MKRHLLIFMFTAALFAGLFYLLKPDAAATYQKMLLAIPSVALVGDNLEFERAVSTYGAATGAGLGLLSLIAASLIYGVMKALRASANLSFLVSGLLAYAGLLALGFELLYLEERNSPLAAAVIIYVGRPLFFTGLASLLAVVALFFNGIRKGKRADTAKFAAIAALLAMPAFLTGCSLIGDAIEIGCRYEQGKEAAHCYQQAALLKNDEKVCAKAPQGEEFKAAGSNPPKDKCYYIMAQNKREPAVCDKIAGGVLSYTVDDCKTKTAEVGVQAISQELESSNGGQDLSRDEILKLQEKMKKMNDIYGLMTDVTKSAHEMNRSIIGNLR